MKIGMHLFTPPDYYARV